VQFLGEWHLTRPDFDVTWAGKTVTAIIDVGDFPDVRDNTSKSPEWNGSRYHDLAVHLSVLIVEQILTWDPAHISSNETPIRRPADGAKPGTRQRASSRLITR